MSKMYGKLVQEKADLQKKGREIFALADKEDRELTDAEKIRDDEIVDRIAAINESLARHERMREWERDTDEVISSSSGRIRTHERINDDPMRGFNSTTDFALAVRAASRPGGRIDNRLIRADAPTNYHYETGSSEGEGYMAPPAIREQVWTLVFNEDDVMSMTDTEPTSRNSVMMARDESTPWGATGVKAFWRGETSEKMTASKLDTEGSLVKLHELYVFVIADEELLEDAPRLNDRLTRKSAEAIRYKRNQGAFEGDGVGKPLGWTKSDALVTQAKEAGQLAGTVVAENVAKMYARVINPAQSYWFINQDVFPQLMLMTLANQPIWTPPATGFINAPGGFLFGRPIMISEHCESIGDKGDIQLINPMGYYSPVRNRAPQFAESLHLFFDYNKRAFRWVFRFGGQPYLNKPVTPDKGSNTRSHFVVLEERA